MPALGIDVGTQSLKAVVLSDGMKLLGSGSVAYQPNMPHPGWAEQDPSLWLTALRPAIGTALESAGLSASDVEALAVCGQLDGCVATDRTGAPLAPAIIWMDRRAEPLLSGLDAAAIGRRCGLVLDATHLGAKIAWFNSNLPRRREVATWHQPVSFVVAALTGSRKISPSLASTTMLYDIGAGGWSEELCGWFGARRGELPEIAGDADVAGRLNEAGATLTGLPVGVPVAVGTGDDFSNLLGCGISRPGTVGVSLGTAETIGVLSAQSVFDPQLLVETHGFPGGLFHLGNPGWLSGGAVRWAGQLLSLTNDDVFSAMAGSARPGCDGLVFIPALSGAMAPKWIAGARGSFVGFTTAHGPAEAARAVLEGTAFAMRDVLARLDALGVSTERLCLMGGGAKSALWCQIRADVTGRPVDVLTASDASATGAAVLAAVVAGKGATTIAEASGALDLPLRRVEPKPELLATYDEAYGRYRAVFAALEPVWLS